MIYEPILYRVVYFKSHTAIPHMVRQGDAPVYYLCVILLIWKILTCTTEGIECEQTMGKCVM